MEQFDYKVNINPVEKDNLVKELKVLGGKLESLSIYLNEIDINYQDCLSLSDGEDFSKMLASFKEKVLKEKKEIEDKILQKNLLLETSSSMN